MNPPDVYDATGHTYRGPDRREGPGQRSTDIERQLADSAVLLAKRGPKFIVTMVSVGGAIGATITFLLVVFGLRIGGAADLAAFRSDISRRDSASDRWRIATDSVTRANSMRIARLEEADRFTAFLLCNIAEEVGARSGGLCKDVTTHVAGGRP